MQLQTVFVYQGSRNEGANRLVLLFFFQFLFAIHSTQLVPKMGRPT